MVFRCEQAKDNAAALISTCNILQLDLASTSLEFATHHLLPMFFLKDVFVLPFLKLRCKEAEAGHFPHFFRTVEKCEELEALQKSLVGEQFTGYLHVTNSSSQTVQNIGLRVEIDVGVF